MIHAHRLLLFIGAATLLAIAPGPGMLYVLARTMAGGKKEGVLSSLGTCAGGMIHVVAAATGLSLALAASATAFAVVKYAGAAYLIYLGLRMVIESKTSEHIEFPTTRRNPFWQGIATEVLNPKTALFFLALIPQFVDRQHGSVLWQFSGFGYHFRHTQHFGRLSGHPSVRTYWRTLTGLGPSTAEATHGYGIHLDRSWNIRSRCRPSLDVSVSPHSLRDFPQ
jgi:threonine/homoserine/homoserine lactone efflux protein